MDEKEKIIHIPIFTYIYIGLRSFSLNAAHTIAQQKSKKAKARPYTYIFRSKHTYNAYTPKLSGKYTYIQ